MTFSRMLPPSTLRILSVVILGLMFSIWIVNVTPVSAAVITGEMRQWHRVTLTFDGPMTNEAATPNPFTDYRLLVTFRHVTTGQTFVVPGFYAADGDAANTSATAGNKWRVHFMPDLVGDWTYSASFRTGANIAVSPDFDAGTPIAFDGETGIFTIMATNKAAPDFRARGLLRYVDGHHLRFAGDNSYFLKTGTNSPENLLAYAEFDDTFQVCCGIPGTIIHQYAPHAGDFNVGDPTWGGGRGDEIIGAMNYLSSQGVNSAYFLAYNLDGGDGRDTWPWTSPTERLRFDVSKLDQWEILFSHMTSQGIQLHFLLQENENDELLGGGPDLNFVREVYMREMVARFAHHPALQWNIGEENDNTDVQRNDFARFIFAWDPYNHPLTVHTFRGLQTDFAAGDDGTFYNGLFGNPYFETTSIQDITDNYNQWAVTLRQQSAAAGRPWVIYGDENASPDEVRLTDPVTLDLAQVDEIMREGMWGNLMGGGGGVEWYFGYDVPNNFGDVQSEDFRIVEPLWQRSLLAVNFFQNNLPFWLMTPDNTLVTGPGGAVDPWALALPGSIYAAYLPNGTAGATLNVPAGTYSVQWFDPINGGGLQAGSVATITGPGAQALGIPPAEPNRDWLAVVQNTIPVDLPPTARNDTQQVFINAGAVVDLVLNDLDDNGINGATVTLIGAPPEIINLGDGTVRYTGSATPGFVTFSYTVQDTSGQVSNVATVTLNIVDGLDAPFVPFVPPPAPGPQVGVFDPGMSKLGLLLPGDVGLQGERIEWVVTVFNQGGAAGQNVVISDTLIPALRIDSVETPEGTATINGQTVTLTFDSISPGETIVFSIFTTVVGNAPAEVSNTVQLTADNYSGVLEVTGVLIDALPRTGEPRR